MPLYRIERDFAGMTDEMIAEVAARAVSCVGRFPGVKWKRSYFEPANQTMTCIYEAPDADAIRRHSEAAKISCRLVAEVIEHVSTQL